MYGNNSSSNEALVDDRFDSFFLNSFVGNIHPFPKCCSNFFLFCKTVIIIPLFLIADAHMITPSPIKYSAIIEVLLWIRNMDSVKGTIFNESPYHRFSSK